MELLADKLYQNTSNNLGADDHMQIAGLLMEAEKIVIDDSAIMMLQHIRENNFREILLSLPYIQIPLKPIWIEWTLPTRTGHGGGLSAKTGCLLVGHPSAPEFMLSVLTGWSTKRDMSDARHSYVMSVLPLNNILSVDKYISQEESLMLVMDNVFNTLSESFTDELSIIFDGLSDDSRDSIYRDSCGEIPLILSIMVALVCQGGLELTKNNEFSVAKFAENCYQPKNYFLNMIYPTEKLIGEHIMKIKNGERLAWIS